MSIHVRSVVFVTTLATVAAVPILIVVYRGRAIGWLMSTVFHENGEKTLSGHTVDGTDAKDQHRHHSFFLLNYTNSGKLSNWRTAVAAACATFVQLTAIVAVHSGYSAVAEWLTKYSHRSIFDPRFQSRYITYMSCFDFANYYSSLIYIAFFKVRLHTIKAFSPEATSTATFWRQVMRRRQLPLLICGYSCVWNQPRSTRLFHNTQQGVAKSGTANGSVWKSPKSTKYFLWRVLLREATHIATYYDDWVVSYTATTTN